jgi:TolB-like protein/Tfp pilus assembly protein PilF
MASLIHGFEYDIFISYRQKDNKHDGWVTKFVDNLKGELEATFKEDVSVYFDENPHDRLQETHNVDKSLEGKLKCLIFIPILSQTYCDPNCYAWQYEFLAFNKLANEDRFGINIRLRSSNYTSRILPVRIHDLEQEDIKLFEKETGSVLRAMDFVFKTATGVSRPLKTNEDHPQDNLNKTFYSDQINKVGHAIKEIIQGMKSEPGSQEMMRNKVKGTFVETREEEKSKGLSGRTIINQKSKKWLIALLSLVLGISGTFTILKIIEGRKQAKDINKLEKSIAVLPFRNDSPNDSTTYFINGIMEKVLNNLQLVKELRVISRTSVEQYRNTTRSIPSIAKEQGVNFIVEGSGQKYGNTFSVSVQLIKAEDEKHLWGESYEQEIQSTKDIFRIQRHIAEAIAEELKATITPDEVQQIEKIPTSNLNAYDLCLRGNEELIASDNTQTLEKAERLYKKALEYDPTYALAYTGLAGVSLSKHVDDSFFSENYLDSVLILADKALSYDNHLPDAYYYRGLYYQYYGNSQHAIMEINKAIECDPNPAVEYWTLGSGVYLSDSNYADYIKALECFYKASKTSHGKDLAGYLPLIGDAYGYYAGFPDKAKENYEESLQLDGDTSAYYKRLAVLEKDSGNNEKAFELFSKAYAKDSSKFENILLMSSIYYLRGEYKESLKYTNKIVERLEMTGPFSMPSVQSIGYVYWQNGFKKEADHWFNKQKRICEESIKLGRMYSSNGRVYYDLAAVHAFQGEKQKTYENLKEFAKIHICPYGMLHTIKTDPFFSSIRNEPEFQKIVGELESKYQAEHERVKKWLEEQGKL